MKAARPRPVESEPVLVPIPAELLAELRAGVWCSGLQLAEQPHGQWALAVHRDLDEPFRPG